MADDNVIKFRKPPPPKKPQKPKPPVRLPAWLIVVAAALAWGGVMYLMDQGKTLPPTASEAVR